MIRRHRGNRRDVSEAKAKRKLRIVKELNDYWHYPHFGQYRKGKIHCSCPMCASKTNASLSKSRGPTYQTPLDENTGFPRTGRRGSRIPSTNGRFGKKNWKPSDRKKVERMLNMEDEFLSSE